MAELLQKMSIILLLLLLFTNTISVTASDDTELQLPTDQQVQEYALNFMRESQLDYGIEINQFVHMYNTNDEITGYYVTFRRETGSAGYMVLSLISGENPVVEFSFENEGPLSEYFNTNGQDISAMPAMTTNIDGNSNLVYTGPDGFYLPLENGQYYSVVDRMTESLSEADVEVASENPSHGIINWADANLNTNSIYKIPCFGKGTDYWLMTDFSSGGVCSPTAATNILWYWGRQCGRTSVMNQSEVIVATSELSKARAIFNRVSQGMGTSSKDGTYESKYMDGFKAFFGESASSNGAWNYKEIGPKASFSSFVEALNVQCPVFLSLYKTWIDPDTNESKDWGHSVYCFGYAYTTNNVPYFFVMDGWNTGGRFAKYNYYPKVVGYKIYVR